MSTGRWITMQCALYVHENCGGVRRGGNPCDCSCHEAQDHLNGSEK